MRMSEALVVWLAVVLPVGFSYETWMSLGMQSEDVWSGLRLYSVGTSPMCDRIPGLSSGQRRLCQLRQDHMESVGRGARAGIAECQHQFSTSRWNCSTVQDSSVFGHLLQTPCRESAFLHSVSSAGVLMSVSRACRDGQLASCSCSSRERPSSLHEDWNWAGCGDNIEYGYRFAKNFVDIKEREKKFKRRSTRHIRSVMNLHNNEAGRLAVVALSQVSCKCHGVSGSCSTVTCWQRLPTFTAVGDLLKDRYDGAVEVKITKRGRVRRRQRRFKKPTAHDLVYTDRSPDYCSRNHTLGSIGTTGRRCSRESNGPDDCRRLCCGRGYNTEHTLEELKCSCKFIWCCEVKCRICHKKRVVYTCK